MEQEKKKKNFSVTAKGEYFCLNELLPIMILQTFLLQLLKCVALTTVNDKENLFQSAVKIHEFHILTSYIYNYIQIYIHLQRAYHRPT